MYDKLRKLFGDQAYNQKGAVLILALILMIAGILITVPLLSFMASGFKTTAEVYDRKADELYAADAGVRHGILQIQNEDGLPVAVGEKTEDFDIGTINGKNVVYNIEMLDPIPLDVAAAYRISSTADNRTTINASAVLIDFTKLFTKNVVTSPDTASIKNNVNFSGPVRAEGFDEDGDGIVDGDIKADPVDGFICSIMVTEPGQDYIAPYVVSVDQAGASGAAATLTYDRSTHTVTGAIMNAGGSGYLAPLVVFDDPHGTGKDAAGTAVVDNATGQIIDVIITDPGYHYLSGGNGNLEVTFDYPEATRDATANVPVIDGVLQKDDLVIVDGGAGYAAPTVIIEDGSGITAKAIAELGAPGTASEGQVVSITPTEPGTGYPVGSYPVVTISKPKGKGSIPATATAVVTDYDLPDGSDPDGDGYGGVTAYVITNPGAGYKSVPDVTVDPSPPGPGTGATAVATVMNTRAIDPTNLSMIWPSAGAGNNALQSFYWKQIKQMGLDESPTPGGTITLDASSTSMFIDGDVTFTTASEIEPTKLADTAEDEIRLIYVDGTVTFSNCNVNLNGYTIFSTSALDATDPNSAIAPRAINVHNSAEVTGPGALIAIGGINFQPKGENTQYIYVMSLNGKVRLAPMNDFVGSVAAPDVVVQSGNGANITWADPNLLDPPLNLPDGEEHGLLLSGFISWIIK